ncbi:peptidoglycan DD-metalloendopeptidase family protein [Paraburkholderia sp. BCC1885]|uniref:peptidoglycan DD-metalloendopeptidase family protein n=1 Tax=Paraburkholderia sp. BCC1885 TaxID=2562669 RepID=UPI001183102A|nr:peptidoglycan DD-metalloendopeptidase family protein [Paraburkholderia sp. BCC1885]
MYSCAQARWRLSLLCVALITFAGCANRPQPVSSPEVVQTETGAASSTAADVPAPLVEAGFYRVNAGDTLTSIAKSFGRAPASVARWNNMSVTDVISVGQVLRVAPPAATSAKSALGEAGKSAAASAKPGGASASASSASAGEAARFKWPVAGPVSTKFVAGRSKGINLGGRVGDPVKAAEGGRVVYAGGRIKAYGHLIVIKHDGHFVTAYGNNRKLLVAEGAVVKQGQTIAEMGAGSDGDASLRFEVHKDGKPVDPLDYLPKRPG